MKRDRDDPLTAREKRVVAELTAIARHWPPTVMLFAGDGGVAVIDRDTYLKGRGAWCLASIPGIPNDGGDPDRYEPQSEDFKGEDHA
jgi:hypothetical protein